MLKNLFLKLLGRSFAANHNGVSGGKLLADLKQQTGLNTAGNCC